MQDRIVLALLGKIVGNQLVYSCVPHTLTCLSLNFLTRPRFLLWPLWKLFNRVPSSSYFSLRFANSIDRETLLGLLLIR